MPTYSVETLCNQALDMIGYTRHIGNIYDGTPAARVALSCYAQTRDELFVTMQPYWSIIEQPMTISGAGPDFPWAFAYNWPTTPLALHILTVRANDITQILDPRPVRFREVILSSTQRLVYTNLASALALYIGQIIDPSAWEADFRMMVVMALANKFKSLVDQSAEKPSEPRGRMQPSA